MSITHAAHSRHARRHNDFALYSPATRTSHEAYFTSHGPDSHGAYFSSQLHHHAQREETISSTAVRAPAGGLPPRHFTQEHGKPASARPFQGMRRGQYSPYHGRHGCFGWALFTDVGSASLLASADVSRRKSPRRISDINTRHERRRYHDKICRHDIGASAIIQAPRPAALFHIFAGRRRHFSPAFCRGHCSFRTTFLATSFDDITYLFSRFTTNTVLFASFLASP